MRMILLALAVAVPAFARPPVAPDKLTLPALKAHVEKYLTDPARKDDLKEFADKLVLSADGLTFAPKGGKHELRWDVPVRKGARLSDTEAKLFPDALKDVLMTAVRSGGLVTTDAGIEYRVTIPEEPEARPATKTVPAVPRMSSQYRWAVIPNGPCHPIPAHFEFSEIPMPVLPPAVWHGEWPATGLTVEVTVPEWPVNGPPPAKLDQISVTEKTQVDGVRMYHRGRALFFRGEHDEAARNLRAATDLEPNDVRAWYLLALAERARGDIDAADTARAEGAKRQRTGKMKADEIGRALERVQGPARTWLREGLDAPR